MNAHTTHPSSFETPTARARRMMPVVERLARRFARQLPAQIEVGDLVGAGSLGLADAIQKRAGDDAASFEAYAVRRILGEMREELRRMDRLTRDQRRAVRNVERIEAQAAREGGNAGEAAAKAGISVDGYEQARALRARATQSALDTTAEAGDAAVTAPQVSAEDAIDDKRRWSRVQREMLQLAPAMRLALATFEDGTSLKHVGSKLGVSEARACQLRQEAIVKLRHRCADAPRAAA
jgi:RNA polymerase sigma factor for flagellar operon FliA